MALDIFHVVDAVGQDACQGKEGERADKQEREQSANPVSGRARLLLLAGSVLHSL